MRSHIRSLHLCDNAAHPHATVSPAPNDRLLSVTLDRDGCIRMGSIPWEEYLGCGPGQMSGRPLLDLIHPNDHSMFRMALQRLDTDASRTDCVVRVATRAGGPVWMAMGLSLAETGDAIHLVARDVTGERRSGGQTPQTDLVLDEISDGVLVVDATREELPVIHANAGFAGLTGHSTEQTIGKTLEAALGPRADGTALAAAIQSCRSGKRATVKIHLLRSDNLPILVRLKLRPVQDDAGTIRQILAILQDISALQSKSDDLCEALQSLRDTKEAIVQRERMHALGKMASGIVHDFNNLLSPILGFAELMLTVPELSRDPLKVESYMRKIKRAANDGAAVVARLREFYRERTEDDHPMDFSVQAAVEETLELTRHLWCNAAQAQGRQIEVVANLQETDLISGSAPEIRQALTNLIHNAIDAMPRGGTIRVSTFSIDRWVCIQIADTGMGMSAEVRRRCFEPFYTTKGKAGTGLGLATVFGTIERHKGRVEIQSTEGHGTVITLWLPAAHNQGASSAGEPIKFPRPCGRTLRVLLVDDEALLLEAVSAMLLEMGHVVDTRTDPRDALSLFHENPYDLVITDRAMPGMSGDQLAQAIRQHKPDAPIVMLTGFGNFIQDSGELVENIDEVVSKPLSYNALSEMLVRYSGPTVPAA